MNKLLKELQEKLDFQSAISSASIPNDLLPSRYEDKVGGELGKEFVAHLERIINEERYSPDEASFIHVPKPGFTTRPAALLTLADRLVYEALIDSIKPAIEKKLISDEYVMWPRANYIPKRWGEFERAPISTGEEYVVNVDVTAFYDSIDHSVLEDKIVEIIGEDTFARAISSFLTNVMGSNRGVPQGILASDTLATLYLQSVDSAMLRSGFNYWRHGDDIRMSAENISLARQAIAIAEIELRKLGLVLNSSKCVIQRTEHYDTHLQKTSKVYDLIKKQLYEKKVEDVSSDSDVLQDFMSEAKLDDQMKWDLFYHESISIEDVIEEIREHLQPDELEIAKALFEETMVGIPDGENPLPKDQFHVQIKKSMLRLAAGKSDIAVDKCSSLIAKFPDKTELVCNYLISLSSICPQDVALQVEDVINSDLFLTAWQKAWIYRVLGECSDRISDNTKATIFKNCSDQYAHWLERVEGFKVLSKIGALPFKLIMQSWEIAPIAYKPDLIASAVYLSRSCKRSQRFLEGIKQFPIERVVARHCMSKLQDL
ncbi:MAG: RNA-directed DNA polymerase [Methylobacter sp.]|nr:RNA-directed DNA polymerase [Methylobacter sp.]MDP2429189.1 RNA-directed DNA polymerase [Methylobacter sp.]MDP3053418.1 RNA-directed DNA polymerase [Methylobacter sp.]MDP3362325.1 RNA-directed DNA polymerase [Methylobacter sp.]MDZ4218189.1 RNA-directed DNA polymerase [Methylobacter sp.]